MRLAQLVGKNAKRFASTQKEVQAETKQLEELVETRKEREEQTKVWEDKIADNRLRKEEADATNSRLEAQLANQLAVNRELEVRLAGLRKLEEAGKNEPEPAGGTEPGKNAELKPAAEPDWLKSMHDIIDGKYDNDLDEIDRLLDVAVEEVGKPEGAQWEGVVRQASARMTELLKAKAKAAAEFYQKQAFPIMEVLDNGSLTLKEKRIAQKQLMETLEQPDGGKAGKTLYERIKDGEFNNLKIGKFVDKVREALKDINGDGVQESKDCAIQYMKAHYDSAKQMFVAV